MKCKGKCDNNRSHGRYMKNENKYCRACKCFMKWGGNRCPCCNNLLRLKSRKGLSDGFIKQFPMRAEKRL